MIITGEIYEMEREWWIIDQIVDKILCNKLKDKVDLSDDEFISQYLEDKFYIKLLFIFRLNINL